MSGFLDKLARFAGYERRSGLGINGWPTASAVTSAGYAVNATLAENLSTTTACVGAVASAIASLPAYVYRTSEGGRTEDSAHPVAQLLRRPNPRQSWPDWIEMMVGEVLLYGNALSIVEADAAGSPMALVPVPWRTVSPIVTPSGRLAFDVVMTLTPWGGTGQPRRVFADECFFLRDRSDDGWLGRSRISRAPEVLGNALALQEFAGSMWRNAATPSGAIQFEHSLSPEQFQFIRAQMTEIHTGAHNGRKVMILDNKAKWQSLSVSPEDAEVLASRRFSVEELCRLFGVPGPIVNDLTHGTFTNSETAGRWFAMFTLAPWCRKIEAEFSRSVFGSASTGRSLEIDLSGLMRGSYAERWTANVAAVQAGILDADEVREAEGWNPRPKQQPAQREDDA